MRLILVVGIWIVIIGGLWLYVWQRDSSIGNAAIEAPNFESAEQQYTLEITPTFSAEEDPFALETSVGEPGQLQISLNGNPLELSGIQLEQGKPQTIKDLKGIIKGHNEIYLNTSPPISQHLLIHGIRIRLFENGIPVLDDTIWNSQGSLVSGTVNFEAGPPREDDHEH